MSKYIVGVFDDEKSVYTGAKALKELEHDASVTIYEGAIIAKDADGKISVKDWEDQGPIGMVTGMMVGSLIGMIAGPIGMLVGATTGSAGGLLFDASRADVNDEFLDDIKKELDPGKFALIAEIEEQWTMPLDTAMEEAGGVIHRAWCVDIEDAQIERDVAARKREIAEFKEEWKQADEKSKAKLQAKMDAAKAKLNAMGDRIRNKEDEMKASYKAKVEKLEQQIAKAKDDWKSKLEKTRDDLQKDQKKRTEKLQEAGQKVEEAAAE